MCDRRYLIFTKLSYISGTETSSLQDSPVVNTRGGARRILLINLGLVCTLARRLSRGNALVMNVTHQHAAVLSW